MLFIKYQEIYDCSVYILLFLRTIYGLFTYENLHIIKQNTSKTDAPLTGSVLLSTARFKWIRRVANPLKLSRVFRVSSRFSVSIITRIRRIVQYFFKKLRG